MQRSLWALAFACAAAPAWAQFKLELDPDWKESEAPPPPALRSQGLVDLGNLGLRGSSLRFALDPASVSIGEADRIVRYVLVATSPGGTVNAFYEGVRCLTGEVKVYAHHNPDSGWVLAREAAWRPLHTTPHSRHSLEIARQGACAGNAPNSSPAQIVRDLRATIGQRLVNP